MGYLIFVSLLWGFSFGLIKNQLTGIDPNLVSFVRLSLAFLVFLPWLKLKDIPQKKELLLIGAIQFGIMYMAYIFSYRYLQAFQVALFTIFTPIYVSLLNDILRRKFNALHFGVALLSVFGTAIIVWTQALDKILWTGFGLVQISNL
jgi:drug/metabolite transporter (DMT)-like permease